LTVGLSLLAIRCPTCGSAAASTTTPNEYECSHCRSKFQIVRPADATVVSDAKAHHCPICGRAVQTLQSYKCTECGKIDFCDHCVAPIPVFNTQRYVCRACMDQKGWACSSCGNYASMVCIHCKRHACGQHVAQLFGTVKSTTVTNYFNCRNCRGQLCSTCIQTKSGIFSTRYYCKKCGAELQPNTSTARVCRYCAHSLDTASSFCPTCGKALA
jgi:DNA-directed RNA polymerase subunit RPC12/RpoP